MESGESEPELRDRVQRLLAFLAELVKARSAPVRVVDKHRAVMSLEEGNIRPACGPTPHRATSSCARDALSSKSPPRPPAELAKYVHGDIADSAVEPEVDPQAVGIEGLDAWLTEWRTWAVVDRERQAASHLYSFLQRAMLDLEDQPESLELVVASGLLHLSEGVAGARVHTHLITQTALIERQGDSGDLVVRLSPSAGPSLEDVQLLTGLESSTRRASVSCTTPSSPRSRRLSTPRLARS